MMKRIYLMILIAWPVCSSAQNWQMVWSDEFDGEVLDTTKWSYQTGTGTEYGIPDWGNNEMQYYKEENVTVGDGMLAITARKEYAGGKTFTSGRIRTIGKGDWKYCKIEFRAKMPIGKGLWAAIWMLPTTEEYGGWALSGELDILEYLGQDFNTIYGTLHFGGAWPNNQKKGTSYLTGSTPFSHEFYDFTLIWEEGRIRWYVNGKLYQDLGAGDWYTPGVDFPAPFDQPFHLLLNLAVGGNWPGPPDAYTMFPQSILVDYIRIYQDLPVGLEESADEKDVTELLGLKFPNPFRSRTTISYWIREPGNVIMEVYDATGKLVRTLVDEPLVPGNYQCEFDGSGLPGGLYSCRLCTGGSHSVRKMLLLD